MKRSNDIEFFKFSIEKVWKMIFKNVWEPSSQYDIILKHLQSNILAKFVDITYTAFYTHSYGAPFVKILYLTDLAQKLPSLVEIAISACTGSHVDSC